MTPHPHRQAQNWPVELTGTLHFVRLAAAGLPRRKIRSRRRNSADYLPSPGRSTA